MSKVALDEARMLMDTFKKSRDGIMEIQKAKTWAAIGLLEAQKENNMLLQAQNEILVTIANSLKLLNLIQKEEER